MSNSSHVALFTFAKQDTVPATVTEREEISLWAYRMAQAMLETEDRLNLGD